MDNWITSTCVSCSVFNIRYASKSSINPSTSIHLVLSAEVSQFYTNLCIDWQHFNLIGLHPLLLPVFLLRSTTNRWPCASTSVYFGFLRRSITYHTLGVVLRFLIAYVLPASVHTFVGFEKMLWNNNVPHNLNLKILAVNKEIRVLTRKSRR